VTTYAQIDPELVEFPPCAGMTNLRDSGEGGLFVWLVVPEPENASYDCHVDTRVNMTLPDVCLTQQDLWVPYRFREMDARLEQDARTFLKEQGKEELAHWTGRVINSDEMSSDLLAAVFIGSTGSSIYDEGAGRYWEASYDDLTAAGQALYQGLKAAFGTEPKLLTFLDT